MPDTVQGASIQYLLNTFLILNILQVFAVFGFSWLDRRQKRFDARRRYGLLTADEPPPFASESAPPGMTPREEEHEVWQDGQVGNEGVSGEHESLWVRSPSGGKYARHAYERRVRRAEICAMLCCGLILCTWALFFVTAVMRLRSKGERGRGS